MNEQTWTRRKILGGLMAGGALALGLGACQTKSSDEETIAAGLGLTVSAANLRRAKALLARAPAIDLHAHPGRFFQGTDPTTPSMLGQGPTSAQTIADMEAGGLAAASFSVVSDMRTLGLTPAGSIAVTRDFAPGEAWADYQRQIGQFHTVLATAPLALVRAPGDIRPHGSNGKIGAILTAEGGDFLEGQLDRLPGVYADGLRSITIVHYRVNEIGDIQTAAPVYNGLSPFGADLIREMNALGLIIDLAHASFDTSKQAAALSTKPLMLSHSHIGINKGPIPRLISPDHARLIADTGGVIGAWPSGIVQHNFNDYIDEILRLVEVVGIDHVAIGTDMDANYKPVFDNYRQLPLIPALLFERGLGETDVAKILGENFLRVFSAVAAV